MGSDRRAVAVHELGNACRRVDTELIATALRLKNATAASPSGSFQILAALGGRGLSPATLIPSALFGWKSLRLAWQALRWLRR